MRMRPSTCDASPPTRGDRGELTTDNTDVHGSVKRGYTVETQRRFDVYYDQELIGTLVPDLSVDDLVIVDPKVATSFSESHFAQKIGYLNITGLRLGLLLNFKYAQLEWKRVVR